jgi:hypothetical protein
MKYNPDIHHRRSIRLRDYDYSGIRPGKPGGDRAGAGERMAGFTESVVEDASLAWLESLRYPMLDPTYVA